MNRTVNEEPHKVSDVASTEKSSLDKIICYEIIASIRK